MYSTYIKIRIISYLTMQKYILKRKKYTYIGKISRNITSSPVCLLKNLELDHLCVLHNETLQAAIESFLHRYKMRNSESYRTLHFLSGMAHTHLPQGVLPLRHTGNSECSMASTLHPTALRRLLHSACCVP